MFASEWQISSVGAALAQLNDGFKGTLSVVETTGIVLTASSGVSLEPAATCSDSFVQEAAGVVGSDWSSTSGMVIPDLVMTNGFNIVGTKQLSWSKFPDAAGLFVGLMSLEQNELHYEEYENYRTRFLIGTIVGVVLLSCFADLTLRLLNTKFQSLKDVDAEGYSLFTAYSANPAVNKVRVSSNTKTKALEYHLHSYPLTHQTIATVEDRHPIDDGEGEIPIAETLNRIARLFLHDLFIDQDTELHLSILLCGCLKKGKARCAGCRFMCHGPPSAVWCGRSHDNEDEHTCYFRLFLIQIFRIYSRSLYLATINLTICVLMSMGMFDSTTLTVQILLLFVLLFDVVVHCIFGAVRSLGGKYKRDSDLDITIPTDVKSQVLIGWLYPLLFLSVPIAMIVDATWWIYALAMMIVVRNDQLWFPLLTFVRAVGNAIPIAQMFVMFVLVSACMILVLLHGRYDTGDYYNDTQ